MILEKLKEVKFSFSKKGRTYNCHSILLLTIIGIMCGMTSIKAISRFGKRMSKETMKMIGFDTRNMPSKSTISYNLDLISVDELNKAIEGIMPSEPGDIIHIDGKVMRGSNKYGEAKLGMVSAFIGQRCAVIGQIMTHEECSEIEAAQKLLSALCIEGRIITGDALYANQNIVRTIDRRMGKFVFTVKDNQPTLKHDIEKAILSGNGIETYTTTDSGHDRVETRTIEVRDMPYTYICEWKRIAQIARITRTVYHKTSKRETTNIVYIATNLTKAECSAKKLLKINRSHWGIENGLHWPKDAILHEDKHNMRNKTICNILSIARNITIYLANQCKQGCKIFIEGLANRADAALNILNMTLT